MNILIFDDDMSTVEMLKKTINWDKFSINKIFSAYHIKKAKEIFIQIGSIDIMLCDIEAPDGTGIDLLRWVRDNSYNTENIFLTNHTKFSYAKEAIKLDCVDYILKLSPLSVIEEAIQKAVNKAKIKNISLKYEFYKEYWLENHNIVTEQFWKDLLLQNTVVERDKILEYANKRKVNIDLCEKFIIILFSITRYQIENDKLDELSHLFIIKNIASDIILSKKISGNIIQIEKNTKTYFSFIISKQETEKMGMDNLKRNCKFLISFCNENLHCNVNCYFGNFVFCQEIGMLEKKLEAIDIDNVCFVNDIFDITEIKNDGKSDKLVLPDTSKWADMLKRGEKSSLYIAVKKYIDEVSQTFEIDAIFMNAFHQDFLQMLFSVLEQEQIQAHKLFSDEKSRVFYNNAVNSIYDMLKWVNFFINRAIDCLHDIRKMKTVIDQVKEYIANNYNKDISRNDIANKFYLNHDYLSRTFNKETGLSIPAYIAKLRINRAVKLLKSGTSISETASLVGYDNFSYFSTVFKKINGISPAEFRKKYR